MASAYLKGRILYSPTLNVPNPACYHGTGHGCDTDTYLYADFHIYVSLEMISDFSRFTLTSREKYLYYYIKEET